MNYTSQKACIVSCYVMIAAMILFLTAPPVLAGPGSMHGSTNSGAVTFADAGDPAHAQSGNMIINSLSGVGGGGNVRFNGTLQNLSGATSDTFEEITFNCIRVCTGQNSLVVNVGPGSTKSFVFSPDTCPGAGAAFSIDSRETDGTLNSVMVFFDCP